MRFAEEAVVVVDTKRADDHSRVGAFGASPVERIVTRYEPDRSATKATDAGVNDLPHKRGRASVIVLV